MSSNKGKRSSHSSNPQLKRFKSASRTSSAGSQQSTTDADIDEGLARFFFGCNIPFNVVESQHFKNFINLLNPSYNPPNRKRLSSQLLDKVYEKNLNERFSISGSNGVLLIDGWKNSSANTKNVVCTIHTVNCKSIFLKSWDLSALRETGECLKKIVDEAKELAKDRLNIKIYAVVSDNASAMMLMGKKTDIWHTSCQSHSGNLLAKALVPEKYAKKVNKLLTLFKTPSAELEIKKRGGSRIILACDTRWCSYRDTFRCLLKNLTIMRELVAEKKIILDLEYEDLLKSPSFSNELVDYIVIFDPICTLINICQESDCCIARGCEEWLKLRFPTINEEYQRLLDVRLKKVLTPIILTANYLHPLYQGKLFKDDESKMESVFNFLKQELDLKEIVSIPGLVEYQQNLGVFSQLREKNLISPNVFWSLTEPFYPKLSSLAIKLLKIPAASAQLERLFSSWAFVHSDLRNRLTSSRSMKLIDIYYSLKENERFHDYDENYIESD